MPLSLTQQIVADDEHRYRVLVCGRRWGKTTLALRELCRIAREPLKDVYYLAPSYRMAKTIAWKRLKNKLLDLNWVQKINETDLTLLLKNGSSISLKGTENVDSLRGVSLSAAVFDEFAFMTPDVWEVIRPALADQQGPALFITTPVGKNNWAYDMFCMQEKYPKQWRSFQYTTLEGGWVTEEEIEYARAEMSEVQFKQEFEASFTTATSLIAWAFSRQHNVTVPLNYDTKELHIGLDFNVSPATACIMVKQGETLYVIDEIHALDSNTNQIAEEILRRYPTSKITVYPDPSGNQRRSSANGATDFTILRNAGFTVRAPSSHMPVRDRINCANARFCNSLGIRQLFISPKCKYTLESLEKYCFKDGTQIPDKGGSYDYSHMFDALSYAVSFMFPIKRNYDANAMKPERWGHALAA